jgi:hypothetical protein
LRKNIRRNSEGIAHQCVLGVLALQFAKNFCDSDFGFCFSFPMCLPISAERASPIPFQKSGSWEMHKVAHLVICSVQASKTFNLGVSVSHVCPCCRPTLHGWLVRISAAPSLKCVAPAHRADKRRTAHKLQTV